MKVYDATRDRVALKATYCGTFPGIPNVKIGDFLYSNDFQVGCLRDVFPSMLALDMSLCDIDLEEFLGGRDPRSVYTVEEHEPVTQRTYDPTKDWAAYGSLLGGLLHLQKGEVDWRNETNTFHASARGGIEIVRERQWLYPDTYDSEFDTSGATIPCYTDGNPGGRWEFYPYVRTVHRKPSVSPNSIYLAGGRRRRLNVASLPGKSYRFDLRDGYAVNHLIYSDFSLKEKVAVGWDDWSFSELNYRFENLATSDRTYHDNPVRHDSLYDVTIRWSYRFLPHSALLLTEATHEYDVRSMVQCRVDLSYSWLHSSGTPVPAGYTYPVEDGAAFNSFVDVHFDSTSGDRPFVEHQVPYSAFVLQKVGPNYADITAYLTDFIEREVHPSILSASAMSTADCVTYFKGNLDTFANLKELKELSKYFGLIRQWTTLLLKLWKGDWSALWDLAGLLAETYLSVYYGIKPDISDMAEYADLKDKYHDVLLSKAREGLPPLYGKFRYEIPTKVPGIPGQLTVMARTKLQLKKGPSTILTILYLVDSLGLLPDPSTLWDLVKFSFVVDWFLNMDKRFEYAQSFVEEAVLDVDYYVHTYLYEFTPEDSFWLPFHPQDDTKFRIFVRNRSTFHPVMRTSCRYDYAGSAVMPTKWRFFAAASLLIVSV